MYCPKCGSYNPDNATNCAACGAELHQGYKPPINQNIPNNPMINQNVPNYLVYSILVTIFCCLPLGIVSIVYSTQVDKFLRSGDYNGAVDASKKAKNFCIISLIIGIIWELIYFFVVILSQM